MAIRYIDNTAAGPGAPDDVNSPYPDFASSGSLVNDTIAFREGQTHAVTAKIVNRNVDRYAAGNATLGSGTQRPVIDNQQTTSGIVDMNSPNSVMAIKNVEFANVASNSTDGPVRVRGNVTNDIEVDNCGFSGNVPNNCLMFRDPAISNCNIFVKNCNFQTSGNIGIGVYVRGVVFTNANVCIWDNSFSGTAPNTDRLERGSAVQGCTGSGVVEYLRNTITQVNRGIAVLGGTVRIGDADPANANTITDCWNGLAHPNGTGHGVEVENNGGVDNDVIVRNNIFARCNRGITNENGSTAVTNNQIIGNVVIDCYVNGIDVRDASTGWIVAHNVVRHSPGELGHGIVYQLGAATSEGQIKNNLVITYTPDNFNSGSAGSLNTQCITIDGVRSQIDVNNNAYGVYADAQGESAGYGALDNTANGNTNQYTLEDWRTLLATDGTLTIGDEAAAVDTGQTVNIANTAPYAITGTTSVLAGVGVSISGINDGGEYGTPINIGSDASITSGGGPVGGPNNPPITGDGSSRRRRARMSGSFRR